MKNRKGFTITELVIVIAVIAILAAVLIPTFTSIVTKANQSAALQEVRSAYSEYIGNNATSSPVTKAYVVVDGVTIQIDGGSCSVVSSAPGSDYTQMYISGSTLTTTAPNAGN